MSDRSIRDIINTINGNHEPVYLIDATVISVDKSKRNCVCQALSGKTQNTLNDVRLMASLDDGMLLLPSIGSTVVIMRNELIDPVIIQYSQVDQIIFNGGDLGGLVKVLSVVDRLNKIENALNDLASKFNAHTHILTLTSGTGTAAVPMNPETTTLIKTVRNDIENTKILQG
jgi:hypothetical protein